MATEQKRFWERWRETWQRWMERREEQRIEIEKTERNPEYDRFMELIDDKEFGKKMEDLYWEIRAEWELSFRSEESIRDQRLREMGFEPDSPEWNAAVEWIDHHHDEHYTAFAEAIPDDRERVEEWERENLKEAFGRLEKRLEKELKSDFPEIEQIKLFKKGAYVVGKDTVGFAPYKDYQLKINEIQWARNPNLRFSLEKNSKGFFIRMSGETNGKAYIGEEAKPFHELRWEIEQRKEQFQQKQQETVMERGLER